MATPREVVMEFERKFGLKVNDRLTELSPEERLLRGRLMLEEVQECFDGLGLRIIVDVNHTYMIPTSGLQYTYAAGLNLEIDPVAVYNPIETADGLGDIVVIANGTANRMGINLDIVIGEIHASNMSKLGEDGEPIVNGITEGYRYEPLEGDGPTPDGFPQPGYDSTKPIGKILKGPNYFKPNIALAIGACSVGESCEYYGIPHYHAVDFESVARGDKPENDDEG